MPSQRSKVEIGPREARNYDLALDLLSLGQYPRFIKRAVGKMGVKPGESVLDLGSGTGKNDCFIAQRAGPQGRVIGLDISDVMLSLAVKRCHRYANVSFRKQRIDLPLAYKEEFDKVFVSFVLHGFENDQKLEIIHNAHQALKPGGVFCILDYAEFDLTKERLPFRWIFSHWECQLAVEFLELDIKEMLRSEGFIDFEEELFVRGRVRLLRALKPQSVAYERQTESQTTKLAHV